MSAVFIYTINSAQFWATATEIVNIGNFFSIEIQYHTRFNIIAGNAGGYVTLTKIG